VIVVLAIHREDEPLILQEKVWYARRMDFHFSMIYEGERHIFGRTGASSLVNPSSQNFDPLHTELVLVLSEEDAVGFPDNVVVAWPRRDTGRGIIIGIHLAISGNGRISPRYDARTITDDINLEDFGLSYPLTFEQLVDDWENVAEFFSYIGAPTVGTIMGHDDVRQRGRTIMSPYNPMFHPMFNYIMEMRFVFRRGDGIDMLFTWSERMQEGILHGELVFVHNREEALDRVGDVSVAWPNEVPWLERRISGINNVVNRTADELMHRGRQIRDVINLDDFGLTYPITIEDTVDNWEGVARLWDALSYYEHRDINIAAAEE